MKRVRPAVGRVKAGKARSSVATKAATSATAKAHWVVRADNATHVKGLTATDKIGIIRAGVSKKQLTEIKQEMDLDYDELSEVLSTSRATLIKKRNTEKFDAQTSERIVLLNDVLAYGREVFEDNSNFNEWLRTPSEALGYVTPLSMMDTLYGIDEVKKEIGRIAYGVY